MGGGGGGGEGSAGEAMISPCLIHLRAIDLVAGEHETNNDQALSDLPACHLFGSADLKR